MNVNFKYSIAVFQVIEMRLSCLNSQEYLIPHSFFFVVL
jgi:hypothetical protein